MLVAASLVLAGCEEEVPVNLTSMQLCLADGKSRTTCEQERAIAAQLDEKNGPVYGTEEDCKTAHGPLGPDGAPMCKERGEFWVAEDGTVLNKEEAEQAQQQGQTVVHHNSGFSPWLYYWMGQQNAQSRTYNNFVPVYPSSGGGYSTLSGKSFPSTGVFKARPSSVQVAPAAKPSRTFVNTSSARGGFTAVSRGGGFGG